MSDNQNIALVGNPNCGKTTLFNALTGLNQKVGNFPGVTVDKRSGKFSIGSEKVTVTDLPGTYSLSSTTPDELVVRDVLLDLKNESHPDKVIIVLDATNLKRNLFLATQVIDLGLPVVCALNMTDALVDSTTTVDREKLQGLLGVPVVSISAKKKEGIEDLKSILSEAKSGQKIFEPIIADGSTASKLLAQKAYPNSYGCFKIANNISSINWLEEAHVDANQNEPESARKAAELEEINLRYEAIDRLVNAVETRSTNTKQSKSEKIDRIVTHPFWGLLVFLSVFFVLFQAVFTIAAYPSDWVTMGMDWLTEITASALPEGIFNDFMTGGILAGIGGIVVFVPQIMILFGLITILEDTGYLSRVSFMTDRLMRFFGMNGKSIVPLVGGFACAVPAIMAARNIDNHKERLITIFITPLMSCSARLPVYIFLVGFVVPDETVAGFINLQGLFMMGLYLIGIVFSLIIALVIKRFFRQDDSSHFILELPKFRNPAWSNVLNTMLNKGKIFVVEAGKVILIATVVLWVLSYFGPSSDIERIEDKYADETFAAQFEPDELETMKSAELLEYSYMGYMGRTIEPAIEPLGFDWKVGIALISSFAAREVFVGSMATIYSVHGEASPSKLSERIHFSAASAFSLLLFYVFAMQCMSTVAIVKQETGSWKITITQFVVFTALAYLASLIAFQLMS